MNAESFSVAPEPGRGFVRIRVTGRLDEEGARKTHAEVTQAHPKLNRLWDFRDADLTGWSAEDMRGFAEQMSAREENPAAVRVAALVSRDVDFGLARMFEILAQRSLPPRYAVFRKESDAEAWVAIDPEPS